MDPADLRTELNWLVSRQAGSIRRSQADLDRDRPSVSVQLTLAGDAAHGAQVGLDRLQMGECVGRAGEAGLR